jgi:hypothetical protein
MTKRIPEKSPVIYARIAGILYLLIIVFGISSEMFIRSSLIVAGDAAATAANILASKGLFRAGFAADALMVLCDVAIAVLFYILLKPVSKILSLSAAVFRLAQAAILGFNLLNYYAALMLLGAPGNASVFGSERLNTLASFYLDMHGHGYDIGLIFFGVSCLILGYLIIRSDYFPAVFGYGIAASGVVYLLGSFSLFLAPSLVSIFEPLYAIPFVAELAFCLWLLIKGVRDARAPAVEGMA